jgi:hypothetical protein
MRPVHAARAISLATDAQLLARAACRFNALAGGAPGCACDNGRDCLAETLFGLMAEAQLAALRRSHRLISSPAGAARQ